MNKRIILVLIIVIAIGSFVLYAIQRGPALFQKPPTEERIAFISDREGHADIWTMKTDGADMAQVTKSGAEHRVPAWSSDAAEIVSVCNKDGDVYQVFVSGWSGAYTQRITTGTGTKDIPTWSRNGEEITYISSGRIFVMSRHGGGEEQYLPPSEVASLATDLPYVYVAWSPDHKLLLCMQETDAGKVAYALELGDSPPQSEEELNPMFITIARNLDVAWSPNDSRVAAAFINRKGQNGLLISDMEMLESGDVYVTKGDGLGPAKPVWSPDGTKIAFEMWQVKDNMPDKCVGIYVMNASGGKPELVLPGDTREPCWSPDGKQIVCTMYRKDEKRDIWRVNADGSNAVNLTKGEGDNWNPAWSPNAGTKH